VWDQVYCCIQRAVYSYVFLGSLKLLFSKHANVTVISRVCTHVSIDEIFYNIEQYPVVIIHHTYLYDVVKYDVVKKKKNDDILILIRYNIYYYGAVWSTNTDYTLNRWTVCNINRYLYNRDVWQMRARVMSTSHFFFLFITTVFTILFFSCAIWFLFSQDLYGWYGQ